jgi:Uma2 family endonuclease
MSHSLPRSAELPLTIERPLTVEDLESLPDDGWRYELILGELIVSPSPNTQHQRILRRLFRLLDDAVARDGFGEVFIAPYDVRLSTHNVVEPDLLVVGSEQQALITERRLEGAPVLVVEIMSPSSRRLDRITKAALYEQAGVLEYWIVDPEQQRIIIQHGTDAGPMTQIFSNGDARSAVIRSFVVTLPDLFKEGAQ